MELVQNIYREIYEARLKGIPVKRLSEKYGISEGCVRTVCSREEQKERLKNQRYYQILISLTNDEELITRTLNVIERNNLASRESICEVTREQLLRYRNCGQVTTELILRTAEILRQE